MAVFTTVYEPITNNFYKAERTLDFIERSISFDQGATYRENLGKVISHIGDAYDPNNESFRSHMGASVIGKECSRAIWYDFRWFTKSSFNGRMIRLFNRGHLEEARFIAILLTLGCPVYQHDSKGKQFRVSDCYGHFGGSCDGIAFNIPDLPNQYILCEFKTHGEKSFLELQKKGVAVAKPEHLIQMNIYMYKMGIPAGLYMAVNKNTDEIHAELIPLNKELAEFNIEKARTLIFMKQPPKKLNESPGYYKCRFCNHRDVCHLNKEPEVNCRTCAFSQPVEDGQWQCNHKLNQNHYDVEPVLTKEEQLTGCELYQRIL